MAAQIAVLKETRPGETRVAATPESVRKLVGLGFEVVVTGGAGAGAAFPDADYEAAGARLAPDGPSAVRSADIVLAVRAPDEAVVSALRPGAMVVALLNPYGEPHRLAALAEARTRSFAMEFVPRISRAQSMDALSSQANLAGYRAVIEGAEAFGRALPMMMTAAGTIAAAKVFVMGVGVAGLQAIATARRLGAVVTATDVRPATKEQVESLGAKFIAVEDEEFRAAETSAGYAREMSAEYRAKQAELVASHIQKQDIVITTALIPGRPAPQLVSQAHLETMKPGAVLIDLAVEQGGNVAGARPDEVVTTDRGVKILGFSNLPGRIASDASSLYARNLVNFVALLLDKEKALNPDFEDEILKGALVTADGAVVHPNLQGR